MKSGVLSCADSVSCRPELFRCSSFSFTVFFGPVAPVEKRFTKNKKHIKVALHYESHFFGKFI